MGLDYSIMLFFKPQDPWPILEGVAEFADHNLKEHTAIQYPDKIMRLPFESWAGTEKLNPIPYDDQSECWDFTTSLYFEIDDEVADYADRHNLTPEGPDQRYVSVGYIYLSVNRLWRGDDDPTKPGWLMLCFTAAATNMSILMAGSPAVRKPFIDLLERFHGTYGLIDREGDAVLIWLRDKEMDEVIPHAYMDLAEIEDYLGDED